MSGVTTHHYCLTILTSMLAWEDIRKNLEFHHTYLELSGIKETFSFKW